MVVPLTEAHARTIQEANHAMASEAIRVIATAYVELPADTVELDWSEFTQYVQDNWGWKKQWSVTNSTYGVG